MRLHYYGHYHGIQAGSGFGSMFARIFSRVASKAVARAALRTAKAVGKRTLRTVARKGVRGLKTVGKELAKEAIKTGAEEAGKAIVGVVNKAENLAINKGVSPELAHKVSATVEEGANQLIGRVEDSAIKNSEELINKTARHINNKVGPVRTRRVRKILKR